MKESGSLYLGSVREILSGLAKLRIEEGSWLDSESEEIERETQSFKIGESLRPFYLAVHELPDQFDPLPLPLDILSKDTKLFFKLVNKDGFFPSPYSPIAGAVDQYTDFAAFTLDFCALTYDFWGANSHPDTSIVKSSQLLANRALDFLLDPKHRSENHEGCRWAGTAKYSRVKKGKEESYTDTFFTSVIVQALNRALDHAVLGLPGTRQDAIRGLVRESGKWIVDRFDNQFVTGDEAKTNRKLLHTTWGLRALAETYFIQEQSVKKMLPAITNAYITVLKSQVLKQDSPPLQQEYLTILSPDVDQILYYEDRSGLAGILLTLVSLRGIPDLERLLEDLGHNVIVEQILTSLFTLRNPTTGLWYREGLILSIHAYLVEAFLMLERRGKEFFGSKIAVSGHMIRNAVRQTLADETIITSLEQAVYQRLLRLVETSSQAAIVHEEMSKLRLDSDRSGREDRQSRETVPRSKAGRGARK